MTPINKFLSFFVFVIVGFLFFSCSHEKDNIWNQTGTWKIEKLEQKFYTDGTLDSAKTIDNAGHFIFYVRGASIFNTFTFKFSSNANSVAIHEIIRGGKLTNPKEGTCNWNGNETDHVISIWVETGSAMYNLIFTKTENGDNHQVLSWLKLDKKGKISVYELYYIEREKL